MTRFGLLSLCFFVVALVPRPAEATASAELYTSSAYRYGRLEARIRFAAGDGVVSSFFLWKDGSERSGTFWNELDYEKLAADCHVQTNALFGNPVSDHGQRASLSADPCGGFHVYAYEWLPDSIAWFVDGSEIRRETGDTARAYADNAPNGMRLHFNVWPGDSTFGGIFNPSILPVHQYIDWVQFSSSANGVFTLAWREDFNGATVPTGWLTGNWASPKNLSTHNVRNVNFISGYAVLSLTADNATGPAGAMPESGGGTRGGAGSAGAAGAGGAVSSGGTGGGTGVGGASGAASSGTAGTDADSGSGATTTAGDAGPGRGPDTHGCGCRSVGPAYSDGSAISATVIAGLLAAVTRRRRRASARR